MDDQMAVTVKFDACAREIPQHEDNLSLLPHLESLERMMKLPVVGAAWQQSQDVYEKVKSHNRMFIWAFSTGEDAVHRAVSTAAPIVSKFDRPIHYVDQTLVKGIDKLEVIAPIIKEQPHEIYNQAKNKVIDVIQPHRSKVCALRVAGLGTISATKLSTVVSQTAAQMNGVSSSTVGGHVVTTHTSTVTTSSINTSTNSPAALILPATVPPTPPRIPVARVVRNWVIRSS